MTESGYHGWTNYETWTLFNWISEGDYPEVSELADKIADNYPLSVEIKRLIEDKIPIEPRGFFYDIISMALNEVNFLEIAEAVREGAGR
ncbi:MAG: hypothetical protein J5I35_11060 [Methanothrix harundinacea]|nr:hypothetical protein [Methanothrix harundinacea]